MKTFKEVARIYSEENPEDPVSPGVASRIHEVAMHKIKEIVGEDKELKGDLMDFLIKGIRND